MIMDDKNKEYFSREQEWRAKAIEKFGPQPLWAIESACPYCLALPGSRCTRSKHARKGVCPERSRHHCQVQRKWSKDIWKEVDRLETEWRISTKLDK